MPGVATTDHVLPFQRSTRATCRIEVLMSEPTAMQLVALEHATPKSSLRCVVGLRVVWIDQAVPLHRSASVTSVLELLNQFPTAVQADPELQATDSSDAPLFAGGFGVVTIDQAIPFQLSARVKGWPDGVLV
jgi:hypothetical protein